MQFMIRYSEIGLKSVRVRKQFENFLIRDIKNAMKFYGIDATIKKIDGRIIIEAKKYAEEILKEIGGIYSFSIVTIIGINLNEIREKVLEYSSYIKKGETFALRVRKIGKHEYSSMDVAKIVGDDIRKKRDAKVDLENPDKEIFIEIREKNTFIYNKIIKGIGGLPYESQGKVISFIENENDLKAAWLMVRRGCRVDFALSKPFEKEIKKMMKWRYYKIFYCKNIEEAERIAIENGAKAIVVGKNGFIKLSIPVFYPLLIEEVISL